MHVRSATRDDLPAIVALLETELDEARERAFAAIEADARNEILVLDDGAGTVLGTLQVTYIPGLGQGGGERATVEAMRVRADRRGEGLGRVLMEAVLARARERGCVRVQLTSNKSRTDAHRFYASLGFVPSHEGFKLAL